MDAYNSANAIVITDAIFTKNGATNDWSTPFNNPSTYPEDTYQLRVKATDNAGNVSALKIITVIVDKTAPTTPTRTNGTLFATSNGVSWSAFSDGANTSGLLLTTLYLQKWNGTAYADEPTFPKSVTGLSYSFTGLTPGTQYRWAVTYTDNATNTSAITYTNFTTNAYSVTTISVLASAGSMFSKRPKIKFTVTDANDATLTNFQIQVSSSSDFSSLLLDTTSSVASAGWGATSAASGATNTYTPQADISVGTRYVRIRANDGKDWGNWSTPITMTIKAVAWPTTVLDTHTAISKRTIDNIRTEVNNVRQARGLSVIVWTNPTINDWDNASPTPIRMGHLTELRQAIVDIYVALNITSPTWTDPIIDTTINKKGIHWNELRNSLLSI
jgi:hypothetical protein